MTVSPDLISFTDNWIVWAILLIGLGCYVLIFNFIFSPRDARWRHDLVSWLKVLPVLLSSLPLLGLLGTIVGLMQTFDEMGSRGGLDQQALLSSGIADALITTQLGLLLVIPGLVMFAYLKALYVRTESILES